MANIWEGTDYNITKIEVKTEYANLDASNNFVSLDWPTNTEVDEIYHVTIQRIPISTYPDTTSVFINRLEYFSNLLPYPLTSQTLIDGILPIINTTIVAYDASFDGSSDFTVNTTGFTLKTI